VHLHLCMYAWSDLICQVEVVKSVGVSLVWLRGLVLAVVCSLLRAAWLHAGLYTT
jgi:hypothetical protein